MEKVVHFEIPAINLDRAKKFYSSAFKWKINDVPELEYTTVTTGPVDEKGVHMEKGFINGGMMKKGQFAVSPIITIGVADMDKSLEAVKEAGGVVVKEAIKVGDMGLAAYFQDTEGNILGLWQNLS